MKSFTLAVCLLLIPFCLNAQKKSYSSALVLSVFPGAGMMYAEERAMGIVFYALEFGAIHAMTSARQEKDRQVARAVFAIIKAYEIGATMGMVYNYNLKACLSNHPIDFSPRLTLSLSVR